MKAYQGKMLFVNLTDGTFEVETFDEKYARLYAGSYGFGAEVMLRKMPAHADPLGPDNMLGFVTGAANATPALFGGRYMTVCKSPLTNSWSDASAGSQFGATLKRSGYDAVFFTGKSEKPVYLLIDNGAYSLHDASDLAGKSCRETDVELKNRHGRNCSVASIGKAGEQMLKLACIMSDDMSAAGRGGQGAVMGSKNLKALVVKGTIQVEIGDKDSLLAWNKTIANQVANPPEPLVGALGAMKMFGTGFLTKICILNGDASVKNFTGSNLDMSKEGIDEYGVDKMQKDWFVKSEGCAQCPLKCKARLNIVHSKWPVGDTERPQYDTYVGFGSNCLNEDMDAVQAANYYCNIEGMDTMSSGAVISWVMQCYEHGLLTKDQLDGIEAKWGDPEVVVELMRKMATGEGVGKILGNGQDYAADYFGVGHEFKTTIGGLEAGLHDHRCPVQKGYARIYQYDPAPGRHTKGGILNSSHDADDFAEKDLKDFAQVSYDNLMGFCIFAGFTGLDRYCVLSYLLGDEVTHEEWLNTTKRVYILRQAFNLREGINAHRDFKFPPLLTEVLKEGPNAGVETHVEEMGRKFYGILGLDEETGAPSKELLEQIGGLELVAKELGL